MLPNKIANYLDMLAVWTLGVIITASIVLQLSWHELPCPLCLWQRFGLLLVALSLALNLQFGRSMRHYGFAIIAALATAIFSIRQVLLHILPGDHGYGSPFWGLSLYSWLTIITSVMIAYSAIMLIITRSTATLKPSTMPKALSCITIAIIFILTLANAVSTFLECGLHNCPPNPVSYLLLSH